MSNTFFKIKPISNVFLPSLCNLSFRRVFVSRKFITNEFISARKFYLSSITHSVQFYGTSNHKKARKWINCDVDKMRADSDNCPAEMSFSSTQPIICEAFKGWKCNSFSPKIAHFAWHLFLPFWAIQFTVYGYRLPFFRL